MVRVNARTKEVTVKIVYYGPGLSGKTTNLQYLHERYPSKQRGELVKLDTESERTLFFDYFPATLGTLRGYQIRVDYLTVPGQSFYHVTRKTVLAGADGVVFVADSTRSREQANLVCLEHLRTNLRDHGLAYDSLPITFQWNKRDVDKPLPVKALEKMLNPDGRPSFEAVATKGEGVWETQHHTLTAVLRSLREASGRRPSSRVVDG